MELNVNFYHSNDKQNEVQRYARAENHQDAVSMLTRVQYDRRLDELSRKVEMCRRLLALIKPQLTSDEQSRIQEVLNMVCILESVSVGKRGKDLLLTISSCL